MSNRSALDLLLNRVSRSDPLGALSSLSRDDKPDVNVFFFVTCIRAKLKYGEVYIRLYKDRFLGMVQNPTNSYLHVQTSSSLRSSGCLNIYCASPFFMSISVLIMGSPGFECVHIDLWVGWLHREFNPGSTSSLLLSSVPGNFGVHLIAFRLVRRIFRSEGLPTGIFGSFCTFRLSSARSYL